MAPLRTDDVQRQAGELPRGVSHPLIVPGLNTEPGAVRQEGIRRTGSGRDNTTSGLPPERELPGRVDSPPAPDGTRRQQYQVEVGGNGAQPTNVERVLDPQGNVIRSSVRYPKERDHPCACRFLKGFKPEEGAAMYTSQNLAA